MKGKRIIWILLVGVIIVIQLIPSGRPEVKENNPNDLLVTVNVPDSVAQFLRRSCYDCHSNQTHYPWYTYVEPVSWLISRDVRLGREHLNFSQWGEIDKMQKAKLLSDIVDEVSAHDMPMGIYILMHPRARLEGTDRQYIVDWANGYGEDLFRQEGYP